MLRPNVSIFYMTKRFKITSLKSHYQHQLKKKTNKQKALTHFDDFYKSVFGPKWPGIRAALLTEHKYIALVNNFGDSDKIKSDLENNGAVNVRLIYENFIEESLIKQNAENEKFESQNDIDEKLSGFTQQKETTEIKAIYSQEAEERLERLRQEKLEDKSRVFEIEDDTNLKSLDKSLAEDLDMDYNRLISAEIGAMGLQEFIPATKLKGMDDFMPESDHYKYYSTIVDFPLEIEPETEFEFPSTLDFYVYPEGDISRFSRPKRGSLNTFSHFLMDGASILPPLMLNPQLGDRVLDACAAPGGKSLIMLQTLLPDMVVCNDLLESRINRIKSLFDQYLMDYENKWKDKRCMLQQMDIRECKDFSSYDKILVDVPCTTDRHSVMEDDNNIFKATRIKERLRIPELQSEILVQCLQLLKPGGSLVYSTCSLSPVQNDGVVHMALSRAFSEHHITATIKDLTDVVKPFSNIIRFENPKNLKYGQLVLPYLPLNFGPMYFCKLTRNGDGK